MRFKLTKSRRKLFEKLMIELKENHGHLSEIKLGEMAWKELKNQLITEQRKLDSKVRTKSRRKIAETPPSGKKANSIRAISGGGCSPR